MMVKNIFMLFCLTCIITAKSPKVYFVLFTHIEDNLPAGAMYTAESKESYHSVRSKLIDMAELAHFI